YVLFYNAAYFIEHPAETVQLWKGGMSFHGGFLGCVLAVVVFARRRGISWLSLGDITCAVAPIGLFLGRIANFINAELWGRTTDACRNCFPVGGAPARAGAGCVMAEEPTLETEIRRRIAAAGPMPVGQYMSLCLTDPEHGYYMKRDPFGARGDFITAPEISQM